MSMLRKRTYRAMLPNCEYCGRFLNPLKEPHESWPVYGYMCVEREAYAHAICHGEYLRKQEEKIGKNFVEGYNAQYK